MLSKETKVDVKNKENKTACFIEIEGLLNSLELISDLPGLGVAEQQGQGSWELQEGERRRAGRRRLCSGASCRDLGTLQSSEGWWAASNSGSGREGTWGLWHRSLCPSEDPLLVCFHLPPPAPPRRPVPVLSLSPALLATS